MDADPYVNTLKKLELPNDFIERFRPRARKKGEPRNDREELLDIFLARLNAGRVADGYPKIQYPRLARVLEGIPTRDLYAFYKQCEQARSFGSYFWWSLKPKEV